MLVKDALGQELDLETPVALAVDGTLGVGTIKKIDAGLGIESQPLMFIQVFVQRPILPNGIAVGVVRIPQPEQTKTVITP